MAENKLKQRRIKRKRKKRKIKKLIVLFILIICFFLLINLAVIAHKSIYSSIRKENASKVLSIFNSPKTNTVVVSAIGDCTLGDDASSKSKNTFTSVFNKVNNYSYFFENVTSILQKDDLTIANLEGPLTKGTLKQEKQFRFKGNPLYVRILKEGSIEAVNLSNNHIFDYLKEGYEDTKKHLAEENIGYFGYNNKYIATINDVKIGCIGYKGWVNSYELRSQIKNDITRLKKDCSLVIISFHWGDELAEYPNKVQKKLGHFAVDSGADLVLGHHPHVIQGIEKYNNKYIVYSLANFCFGGNNNPSDKDTFIFQQSFSFDKDAKLTESSSPNIIPCSVSSKSYINDYKPTILMGKEKERVIKKIQSRSIK